MPIYSKQPRIILFFVTGLGLSLAMASLKAIASWLAETYVYSVPWMGGFLKSMELAEISNWVVFALLGSGIGAATFWLPRRWTHAAKIALLAIVTPFVFSASYWMQQHLWIQRVAVDSGVSYRSAQNITNSFLEREAGSSGFFGFYPLSTQLADFPTRRHVLESRRLVDPNHLLTQELESYNDPRADFAAYLFEQVGWLVRLMYMVIATLTGLIYYFKGHSWAENRRQASSQPPVPTPPKVKRKAP